MAWVRPPFSFRFCVNLRELGSPRKCVLKKIEERLVRAECDSQRQYSGTTFTFQKRILDRFFFFFCYY